jgi:hypothetical protein
MNGVRKIRLRSDYAKVAKRLKKMSKSEVLDWADEYGNQFAKALLDYRRNYNPLHIEEADYSMSALAACVDELKDRNHALSQL